MSSWPRRCVTYLAVIGIAIACSGPVSASDGLGCYRAGWVRQVSHDGSISFCGPAELVDELEMQWWTSSFGAATSEFQWLTVRAMRAPADADITRGRPQSHLGESWWPCGCDPCSVSNLSVRLDSIAGTVVRSEAGQMVGGCVGARGIPALDAVWVTSGGYLVAINAGALTREGLDRLRDAVVRTIEIRGPTFDDREWAPGTVFCDCLGTCVRR